MNTIAILNLVPLAHSTAILAENIKLVNKKNKTATDFIGTGIKNIIGAEFVRLESNIIGGLK